MYKYKKYIPWIATVAGLVALICFVAATTFVSEARMEDGVSRAAVETEMAQLLAEKPSTLDDAGFGQALEMFKDSEYVVYVWLIKLDGEIAYANSRFANSGNVEDQATAETLRVLEILPSSGLSEEERVAVLAASAIMSEGEHNDVFRQLLRPVYSAEDELVGWIGVAFEANVSLSQTNWVNNSIILLWFLGTGVYWLLIPAWVWMDAKERKEQHAAIWALFVLMGNLVALIAYILTRPRKS